MASLSSVRGLAVSPAHRRPAVSELVLQCSDGIRIAAQSWSSSRHDYGGQREEGRDRDTAAAVGEAKAADACSSSGREGGDERRVLCLHGWMDNSASFYHLGPAIVEHFAGYAGAGTCRSAAGSSSSPSSCRVVGLDFPGHGLSSHRSVDAPPTVLAEAVFYVAEAVRELRWDDGGGGASPSPSSAAADPGGGGSANNGADEEPRQKTTQQFALVGHSMGAAVSLLYAAAFPEQVSSLVLLEGAGPLARPTRDVARHVRRHVVQRQRGIVVQNSGSGRAAPRIYPSIDKAVQARCLTARNAPGNQYLSVEAAKEIVSRGTQPAAAADEEGGGGGDSAAVQFRHDPRLQWPSLMYFTVEQNEAMYRDVECPTALITAEDGWSFEEATLGRVLDLLKPTAYKTLPGSHHFHADPATAPLVAREVIQFLEQRHQNL